ncbi:MAG: 2,3-diphosphoglycerate synthetase [Acidimicrobiales bacterium]
MRVLALVDGEHYPRVVRAALDRLPDQLTGATVVAAALLGGTEKLPDAGPPDLGVPVVTGPNPDDALLAGLRDHRPDLVVDLSDEPVVDDRSRLRLAARALVAGVGYVGADFRFDPPPRPRLTNKPTIAVIGTGKRTGKTAVSAHLARHLATTGTPPVVVAMGRGGPPAPELIDPATTDLTVAGLLALADAGRHAASDHIEDALLARVATVGTRRCGGGLFGAPFDATFAAGVELARTRPEPLLVYEGSGRAIPPAHADVTVCVVPAAADPELVCGYAGGYRVLLSDAVVITMADEPTARSGGVVVAETPQAARLERSIRDLAPGARIVRTVFRPAPLIPISGRRIVFATTAPEWASPALRDHLEREHGGVIIGVSHHLANRPELRVDLEAMDDADVLLVELKAAAIDVAARAATERGMEVVFCDNQVVAVDKDSSFEELVIDLADLAVRRHHQAGP